RNHGSPHEPPPPGPARFLRSNARVQALVKPWRDLRRVELVQPFPDSEKATAIRALREVTVHLGRLNRVEPFGQISGQKLRAFFVPTQARHSLPSKSTALCQVSQPPAQRFVGPEQQRLDCGFRTA